MHRKRTSISSRRIEKTGAYRPRNVDVANPETRQYPGWPVIINQYCSNGRKVTAYLPALTVTGQKNPLIQIVEAGGTVD
jgi:hypothetical protein